MTTQPPPSAAKCDVRAEIVESEEDVIAGFNTVAEAFGRQTQDALWISMNPGWDALAQPDGGRARGAARMVQRWRSVTRDRDGNPNTVFLKGTVPDPADPSRRVVAAFAIWQQASFVPGRGDPPTTDMKEAGTDPAELHPGDEGAQRFAAQLFASLFGPRKEALREKQTSDPESPVLFLLDLCAVHPDFQRRGLASALVRWGLDEARRRGGLECATEASVMGRLTYPHLGFRPVAEVEYKVDPEFRDRKVPPNLFMRTGAPETGTTG